MTEFLGALMLFSNLFLLRVCLRKKSIQKGSWPFTRSAKSSKQALNPVGTSPKK